MAARAAPDDEVPRPDIPPHLAWVWRAWHRLHSDRPWLGGGMGPAIPGRIPWDAVRGWCEFHDLAGEAVPYMDAIFAQMDAVFIEWHNARQAKPRK